MVSYIQNIEVKRLIHDLDNNKVKNGHKLINRTTNIEQID